MVNMEKVQIKIETYWNVNDYVDKSAKYAR